MEYLVKIRGDYGIFDIDGERTVRPIGMGCKVHFYVRRFMNKIKRRFV